MLNPVIVLSRAILVALIATFAVVAVMVIVSMLGVDHIINEMLIGLLFAAGLAVAGVIYGHQQRKQSTTPPALQVRLGLILFAIYLLILSALQLSFGEVTTAGHTLPIMKLVVPVAVAVWLAYWCARNVLNISEEQAQMIGSKKSELALLCVALIFAPALLLIPGFSLAEMFNFDPQIILLVFQYAPIMSAAIPLALTFRKLIAHKA